VTEDLLCLMARMNAQDWRAPAMSRKTYEVPMEDALVTEMRSPYRV